MNGFAIVAIGAAAGVCASAMVRIYSKASELRVKRAELNRMSATKLHAELTRCAGAIMECARIKDEYGVRHAYRAMRPIIRALLQK